MPFHTQKDVTAWLTTAQHVRVAASSERPRMQALMQVLISLTDYEECGLCRSAVCSDTQLRSDLEHTPRPLNINTEESHRWGHVALYPIFAR